MTFYKLGFFVWALPLFFGCKEADFNDLQHRQGAQQEQLRALAGLCDQLNRDIRALEAIVNAVRDKNYITAVAELPDSSGYVISFSKSDPITIRHGHKGPPGEPGGPGHDGEAGKDGAHGSAGEPGKDGQQGNQGPDGNDGRKGDPGEPGLSPVVGIVQDPGDREYYWTIQVGDAPAEYLKDGEGNRVKAKCATTDGTTPRLSIEEWRGDGGGFYWMQQIGSGPKEWVLVNGEKVKAQAGNAAVPSKFQSVDDSHPDFVEFTLIDGLTRIKVPRGGGSIVFAPASQARFFRRGERQTVAFACTGMAEGELKLSLPAGWTADGDVAAGSFTLTAPEAADLLAAPDGSVRLSGISRTGEAVEALLPVTLLYQLPLPDFKGSGVYNLYLEGDKVGEVCREYIPAYSTTRRATVVYPYSAGHYGLGLILENGGRISYDGLTYRPANQPAASVSLYTEDGTVYYPEPGHTGAKPGLGDGCRPEVLTDAERNSYPVVKIGTQYWTADNLRTLTYADGKPIDTALSGSAWTDSGAHGGGLNGEGACAVYDFADARDPAALTMKRAYGVLYNYNAARKVIPAGWKLPETGDISILKSFLLSRDAFVLKESGTAHWAAAAAEVSNLTGFTARGGGYREASGTFAGLLGQACWWMSSGQENVNFVITLDATGTDLRLTGGQNNARGYAIRLLKK